MGNIHRIKHTPERLMSVDLSFASTTTLSSTLYPSSSILSLKVNLRNINKSLLPTKTGKSRQKEANHRLQSQSEPVIKQTK